MKFNVTLADLQALNPCHPAESYLGKGWRGTLLDILEHKTIKDEDKIWAVTKLLDEKTARLFAVYCAREAIKLIKDPDQRIVDCVNVAERSANGQATDDERSAAWSAAQSAAYSAAAQSAAQSAARSAAYSAAYSAARSAAQSAAYSAAAARSAAADAAYSAARSAAQSAQVQQLTKMVRELSVTVPKPTKKLEERTSEQLLKFVRNSEEAKRLLIERIKNGKV